MSRVEIDQWDLASQAEIGTASEIDATEQRARFFTVVGNFCGDEEPRQSVDMAYLPPEDPASQLLIIKTLPIIEMPQRAFESGRNAAMVNETNGHLLVVGSLGVGLQPYLSGGLDREQRTGLVQALGFPRHLRGGKDRSTFDLIGKALAAATVQGLHGNTLLTEERVKTMRVVADLNSLGNNSGMAMVGHLPEYLHPDVVISRRSADPGKPVSYPAFMLNFFNHGDDGASVYNERNGDLTAQRPDTLPRALGRFMMNPRLNFYHYAAGTAGASVIGDMYQAYREGRFPSEATHVIVAGSESLIDRPSYAENLQRTIEGQIGARAVLLEVGGATHLAYNNYRLNAAEVTRALKLASSLT